jgi:PAS domain S-box-containing protein
MSKFKPGYQGAMREKSREQYLRELIDASPIACILTDATVPDNPIVAANEAFARLTGYRTAEILGRNCRFLSGEGTDPAARAIMRQAVSAAMPAVVEILNYKRDGSPFRNAVMIAPSFDAQGELAFFLGSQMEVGPGGLDDRRETARRKTAQLSLRQIQVLRRMAGGMRHAQIARELGLSEKTVKMHRAALVAKLGCQTSAEAIRIAVEADL